MQFTFQTSDGQPLTMNLTPQADGSYLATSEDRSYTIFVRHSDENSLLIEVNGQQHLLYIASENGTYHIALDGQSITLQKATSASRGAARDQHTGDLNATMPGQVTQILVTVGDEVQKGQTLVLLEAMKMEMRVKAPQEGRVKAILCTVGQAVERGQLLIELD